MNLVKCNVIQTLDDPLFYARVNGKLVESGEIVKAYREYWFEHNTIKPSQEEIEKAERVVNEDLADEYGYRDQQTYCWELY